MNLDNSARIALLDKSIDQSCPQRLLNHISCVSAGTTEAVAVDGELQQPGVEGNHSRPASAGCLNRPQLLPPAHLNCMLPVAGHSCAQAHLHSEVPSGRSSCKLHHEIKMLNLGIARNGICVICHQAHVGKLGGIGSTCNSLTV